MARGFRFGGSGGSEKQPVDIIINGILQNGFTLSGNVAQEAANIKVTRDSSTNGGKIELNKNISGYSALSITGGNAQTNAGLQVDVGSTGKYTQFPIGGTSATTRSISLDASSDSFNFIGLSVYNNQGICRIQQMTLIP